SRRGSAPAARPGRRRPAPWRAPPRPSRPWSSRPLPWMASSRPPTRLGRLGQRLGRRRVLQPSEGPGLRPDRLLPFRHHLVELLHLARKIHRSERLDATADDVLGVHRPPPVEELLVLVADALAQRLQPSELG